MTPLQMHSKSLNRCGTVVEPKFGVMKSAFEGGAYPFSYPLISLAVAAVSTLITLLHRIDRMSGSPLQ